MTPKQKQYYDMEVSRQGALIHHALQLLYDQKLDTSTRRTLGVSAKHFLVDHHLKDGRLPDHDLFFSRTAYVRVLFYPHPIPRPIPKNRHMLITPSNSHQTHSL